MAGALHPWNNRLHPEKDTGLVDFCYAPITLERGVGNRRTLSKTGVVDQHSESTKGALTFGKGISPRFFIRNIKFNCDS